LLFFFL
jgi:hypothetical protein